MFDIFLVKNDKDKLFFNFLKSLIIEIKGILTSSNK